MKKSTFIAAGIAAAAILLIVVMVAGINNRAISLEELGEVLGRYDGDGQREALAHTRAELSRALEQAREAREKQGRMYQVLGITAGAFLVILLL